MLLKKQYNEKEERKKSKGVIKRNTQLNYQRYEEPRNREMNEQVTYNSIRSKDHQMYSIKQTEFALSNYDDKRCWLNDCESLPMVIT